MSSVTAQLQLLQQLEGQLLKLRKEKSFVDPALKDVRKQFRATAEAILLKNYRTALEKSIETKLWHLCFHRPVQEFRRRIQEHTAKGEKAKELVAKLKKAFGVMLTDGMAFYKAMAYKLQLVYGDVGYKPSTRELGEIAAYIADVKLAEKPVNTSLSVHRCLICIGDLTRYQLQKDSEGNKIDWSAADELYQQAIKVFPEGGNAYNQRAVLAAHEGRDLQAVYNYVRSLAVASPFSIARENLVQLFEKVREEHSKLAPAGNDKAVRRPSAGWKLPELAQVVQTRFLHLQGLLFTAIDFDNFGQLLKAGLADLDDFLARDAVVKGPLGYGPDRSDIAVQQLAALIVYNPGMVANSSSSTSESEAAKQTALKRSSMDLFFVFTSRLCQVVANAAGELSRGVADSPLLPAINILLQWIATNSSFLKYPDIESTVGRNFLCKALSEFVVAAAASCEKAGWPPSEALQAHCEILQALPEDWEMRGYTPLLQIQHDLDYSRTLEPQIEVSSALQEAVMPRLKRIVVLLHKIGEGLHAAQACDHSANTTGGKLVASFLNKLASSWQATSQPPAAPRLQPDAQQPEDSIMKEADEAELEGEEVIVFNPSPSPVAKGSRQALNTGSGDLQTLVTRPPSHLSRPAGMPINPFENNLLPGKVSEMGQIHLSAAAGQHSEPDTRCDPLGMDRMSENPVGVPVPLQPVHSRDEDLRQDVLRLNGSASGGMNGNILGPNPQGLVQSNLHLEAAQGLVNQNTGLSLPSREGCEAAGGTSAGQVAMPSKTDVLVETQEQLSKQEPALSAGLEASVARLNALGEMGGTRLGQPSLSRLQSQESLKPLTLEGMPSLGCPGSHGDRLDQSRPDSALPDKPSSPLGSISGLANRPATSFDPHAPMQSQGFTGSFPGPAQDLGLDSVLGRLPSLKLPTPVNNQPAHPGVSQGLPELGYPAALGKPNLEGQPSISKQFSLPQTSWSAGTGVHIPTPQHSSPPQEAANQIQPATSQPGLGSSWPLKGIPPPLQPHDSLAYSSALQKQIAQVSPPPPAALAVEYASLKTEGKGSGASPGGSLCLQQGPQPFDLLSSSPLQAGLPSQLPAAPPLPGLQSVPQLPRGFQQLQGSSNSAQMQALLAQLNQPRGQTGLGTGVPPYPVPPLAQQSPLGLTTSLQAQLAQAREQPPPHPPQLNTLAMSGQLQTSHLPSQGRLDLGVQPPQQAGLSPAQYQALLHSLPPQHAQQTQLEQLLRSQAGLVNVNQPTGFPSLPGLGQPQPEEPLHAYQQGLLRGGTYGGQTLPSAMAGNTLLGNSYAPSNPGLQYQSRLNNLAAQKPSARPPSLMGGAGLPYNSGSALQPNSVHTPYSPMGQHTLQDRPLDATDNNNQLQQLLARQGKDFPLDLLLQSQRTASHQQRDYQPQPRFPQPRSNPALQQQQQLSTNPTTTQDFSLQQLQQLLAGSGPSQAHQALLSSPRDGSLQAPGGQLSYTDPGLRQASRVSEPNHGPPFAGLQRQLAALGGLPGSGQVDLPRPPSVPSFGGPRETPLAQGVQLGGLGLGQGSGRQESTEPRKAEGHTAGSGGVLPFLGQRPLSVGPPPAVSSSQAGSVPQLGPERQATDPALAENAEEGGGRGAPPSENMQGPNKDWGPFTGLNSAGIAAPWSQPWNNHSGGDQPKPNPGSQRLGTFMGSGHRESAADPHTRNSWVSSALGQGADKEQKQNDLNWQAQLASLQNASRLQRQDSATGLQGLGAAARYTPNTGLYGAPSEQPSSLGHQSSLGVDRKPSAASLFTEPSVKRPDSRHSIEPEPMIPSWLQTTSQGSGVWGAPTPPAPNPQAGTQAAKPHPTGLESGAADWLAAIQQQQRNHTGGPGLSGDRHF